MGFLDSLTKAIESGGLEKVLDTAEAKLKRAVDSTEKFIGQTDEFGKKVDTVTEKTGSVINAVEQKLPKAGQDAVASDADS